MASFQAKTRWDRQRMREKIKHRSYQFLANPEYGIPKKIAKKFKKLKNIIMASFQVKTGWVRLWVMQKKKKLSFKSIPTRPEIWISKKIAKNGKKKKRNIIVASFQAKTGCNRLRMI